MFEELLDAVVPGGGLIALLGVAVGAAFGKQLRSVAKGAVKMGLVVGQQAQGLAAETIERGQDLVAEARSEQDQALVASGGAGKATRPRAHEGVSGGA